MSNEETLNKSAFDEVIGDPFAIPEPIDGMYIRFKNRSVMGNQRYNFNEGHATRNAAQPSQLDFMCDVEMILAEVLGDSTVLIKFNSTYIVGDIDAPNALNQAEREALEQIVGKQFRTHNISPVSEYFRTIRTGSPGRR